MTIYKEISLSEFEAWSGAQYTIEVLEKLEEATGESVFDTLESILDDCGEGMDETKVNDFLWFEDETIAEWLGFESWEHLEAVANGEDWEEEEEEEEEGE